MKKNTNPRFFSHGTGDKNSRVRKECNTCGKVKVLCCDVGICDSCTLRMNKEGYPVVKEV